CNGSGTVIDTSGSHASVSADPSFGISIVDPNSSFAYDSGVSPTPTVGVPQIPVDPLGDLADPVCTPGPGGTIHSGTINPGTYGTLDATGALTLNPGLYCIT